jgi:predicted dehydrogenase
MSDLEYQLYNWYHFVWLSGDQIAEQAVHNLDAVNWAIGANPVSAYGGGGQMTRPADSEIWDNINIDYAYPGNVNVSFKCRQIPNTKTKVINTFVGTKGIAWVNPGGSHIESHDGEELFHYEGRGNNPYQQEHADLIASVRAGTPIVEIQDTADSSLTAVLGRMAAYTGQEVEWDFAVQSKEALMPPDLGPDTVPPAPRVRVPGREPLI